jgi:hypothetical protein
MLEEIVNATYLCNCKISSKGSTAKINLMLHKEDFLSLEIILCGG